MPKNIHAETRSCPVCGSSMLAGEVALKRTVLNQLSFGFGSSVLVFKDQSTGQQRELLDPWKFSKAYLCDSCGAALIATEL